MDMCLSPIDPRIRWEGHAELKYEAGWVTPCRLKGEGEHSLHPELLQMADMAAGVRINLSTDASSFSIDVETTMPDALDEAISPFDVMIDGRLASRQTLHGGGAIEVAELGGGVKDISVWLPQFGVTRLRNLTFQDASFVSSFKRPKPHWIAYGSSITHCREALGPSDAWTARVAIEFGWGLTALGFAGQCHLDPVVAQYMRNTPAELISMCVGINIWAASSLSSRTLGPTLAGFLDAVREGHPATPLVIMTPIVSPEREHKRNGDGLTLDEIRTLVRDVALGRRDRGDSALTVVDGRAILGEGDSHLLVDGLHPGPEGYRLMADRLGPVLKRALLEVRS